MWLSWLAHRVILSRVFTAEWYNTLSNQYDNFTNLATKQKLTKHSFALFSPLRLQLSKMPSVCKKTISPGYQHCGNQLIEEIILLLKHRFLFLGGVQWYRANRQRRKHCETTVCLTSTYALTSNAHPHSSHEGVSRCMCVFVSLGREWRETNASSTHLHAQSLCHINPLSMCVRVWACFSVQHVRLADSPPFPGLTRRANVRFIISVGLNNTDTKDSKPTTELLFAHSGGQTCNKTQYTSKPCTMCS